MEVSIQMILATIRLLSGLHFTPSPSLGKAHAPGLNVRQALDALQAMQMLDVHFPTSDGLELIFTCYTESESDQQLLLAKLGWTLPPQAPPKITAANLAAQM